MSQLHSCLTPKKIIQLFQKRFGDYVLETLYKAAQTADKAGNNFVKISKIQMK